MINAPLLSDLLATAEHTHGYQAALMFFGGYPIVTSLVWIVTSIIFWLRRERGKQVPALPSRFPKVSVLIAAHNEEEVIGSALAAVCAMDYPDFEVVVVDDGSTDGTAAVVQEYVRKSAVRLVRKNRNEGKAMALNDGLPCTNGEILLILDADAEPEPHALRAMAAHFACARVAAVTGNPRVKNVNTFVSRLELIEFTSIVSILRRAQRVWGRILTVSGIATAFRRSAILDVGGFSPNMPTEDIELTWKLQKRFWDVRYEANAVVWMRVPGSLRGLFRQRLRWARGLMQVLRKHGDVLIRWKHRRMWPVAIEAALSILWAVCFVVLTSMWILSYAVGYPPVGAHPLPNFWGMLIATLAMLQLLTGTLLDRAYDRGVLRYYPYAVFYPLAYWMLMSVTTTVALPSLFQRPPNHGVRWRTQRTGSGA